MKDAPILGELETRFHSLPDGARIANKLELQKNLQDIIDGAMPDEDISVQVQQALETVKIRCQKEKQEVKVGQQEVKTGMVEADKRKENYELTKQKINELYTLVG